MTSQGETSRGEQYRDLLETWTEWWNNIGRYHFTHYITPPITATGDALACTVCVGIEDDKIQPGDRCQVCGRRMDRV